MTHLHHKVSALVDGELGGAARKRALSHARQCEACRNELEQTIALKRRLLGLAAAEPHADLLAALGTVRPKPEAADSRGTRRLTTGRALAGAGSMSAAILTLAYMVGGAHEPALAQVSPPVEEFAADFATATGQSPLADPAVGAPTTVPSAPLAVSAGRTSKGGAPYAPSTAIHRATTADSGRAIALLREAARASDQTAYRGLRRLTSFDTAGRVSSVVLDVAHAPGQGTSISRAGDSSEPARVFVTGADQAAAAEASLDDETIALLAAAYELTLGGGDEVAGRSATVVDAYQGGQPAARFFVDDASGLLVRRDVYDAGRLVRSSGFVSLHTSRDGFLSHLPPELTSSAGTPLPFDFAPALSDQGWTCPDRLPGGFSLVQLRRVEEADADADAMHAAYSDGLSTISVYEERGELREASLQGFTAYRTGRTLTYLRGGLPTMAVWESAGTVYTAVTDAPDSVAATLIAALPHEPASSPADGNRIGSGLARLAGFVNPVG